MVKSRTQRRMEKKQALVLLLLVLAVSLVSFSLGVMVGKESSRSGAPLVESVEPEPRIPVVKPIPEPPPAEEVAVKEVPGEGGGQNLTFYETLPRGEAQPLGSGINLPPESPEEPVAQAVASPVPVKETSPAPVAQAASPVAEKAPAPLPEVAAQGRYLVQVASFKEAAVAAELGKRLGGKGYRAFVEEADLGPKGVWHRVMVGPFAGSSEAGTVAARLKAEEKLAGIVKKR